MLAVNPSSETGTSKTTLQISATTAFSDPRMTSTKVHSTTTKPGEICTHINDNVNVL